MIVFVVVGQQNAHRLAIFVAAEITQPAAKKANLETSVNQELLKIFLISSRPIVSRVIHSLHCHNFACVSDWSPLVPTHNSGEVMSVLIKYFAADS